MYTIEAENFLNGWFRILFGSYFPYSSSSFYLFLLVSFCLLLFDLFNVSQIDLYSVVRFDCVCPIENENGEHEIKQQQQKKKKKQNDRQWKMNWMGRVARTRWISKRRWTINTTRRWMKTEPHDLSRRKKSNLSLMYSKTEKVKEEKIIILTKWIQYQAVQAVQAARIV